MTRKPSILRDLARRDVEAAVEHYSAVAGEAVAVGFIDALERAFDHLARHPATGSPRHAHELDLPGLRVWAVKRYPYPVFYVERDEHLDVWRVLHAERDIPASVRGTSSAGDVDAC